MTTRRTFITGLVSLVAAPAIVRAEERIFSAKIHGRTFDVRGNPAAMLSISFCEMTCCRILCDGQTDYVRIQSNTMLACLLDGVDQLDGRHNLFMANAIWSGSLLVQRPLDPSNYIEGASIESLECPASTS